MPRLPSPRTLLAAAAAFALTLGGIKSAAAQPDTMLQLEGTEARIAKHREDAKRLAKTHMPDPDELGDGWHRPWEAPRGVSGIVPSESYYWRKFKVHDAWAQYFGMKEYEIVEAIKGRLDPIYAQMAGQPMPDDVPESVIALMRTKAGMLSIPMMNLRKHTMLVHLPQVLAITKMQTIGHEVTRAQLLAKPEERERIVQELMPDLLNMFGANLSGKSYDEALRTLAREARSVRRGTTMVYIHAEPKTWKQDDGKTIPSFAVFTVKLHIAARSAIGTKIEDINAENVAKTASTVTSSLRKSMKMAQEFAEIQVNKQIDQLEQDISNAKRLGRDTKRLEERMEALNEQLAAFAKVQNIKADIQLAEHGENAWVMSIENLPTVQSKQLGAFHARLRNGNAIVDVEAKGTYSKAFILKHLDYLLASLDESTQVFTE